MLWYNLAHFIHLMFSVQGWVKVKLQNFQLGIVCYWFDCNQILKRDVLELLRQRTFDCYLKWNRVQWSKKLWLDRKIQRLSPVEKQALCDVMFSLYCFHWISTRSLISVRMNNCMNHSSFIDKNPAYVHDSVVKL